MSFHAHDFGLRATRVLEPETLRDQPSRCGRYLFQPTSVQCRNPNSKARVTCGDPRKEPASSTSAGRGVVP